MILHGGMILAEKAQLRLRYKGSLSPMGLGSTNILKSEVGWSNPSAVNIESELDFLTCPLWSVVHNTIYLVFERFFFSICLIEELGRKRTLNENGFEKTVQFSVIIGN